MNIGEKIKYIRTSKMMTQSELAGDMITRNMLSRIENGAALPSLPTLEYIAAKLSVPAGYFLADEDKEIFYLKAVRIDDIKKAFSAGDWKIGSDLCKKIGNKDDEINYINAVCIFNLAKEDFIKGEISSSIDEFEEAASVSGITIYPTDWLIGRITAYLFCISEISPSFDINFDFPASFPIDSAGDSFCKYYMNYRNFSINNNTELSFDSDEETEEIKIYKKHLKALKLMNDGEYPVAAQLMRSILSGNADVPAPMMFFIFSDLEKCCKEQGDFKGAYEYAAVRTSMLERFLRQKQ